MAGVQALRHDVVVRCFTPCVLASLAFAGCGGSVAQRDAPPAEVDAGRTAITGELRTPDARTPLVQGSGLWHCDTPGRLELRLSPDGFASLSIDGRLLASVSARRSLINRACTSQRPEPLPSFRAARGAGGESSLRCKVPQRVLVDLRDGDLTVREPGRRRFLLGAAVSPDHLEVAGYWSTSCSLRRAAG